MGSDSNQKTRISQFLSGEPPDGLRGIEFLVDDWTIREPDSGVRDSLGEKLLRLSPDSHHLAAGLLYHLFPDPGRLPERYHPDSKDPEEHASDKVLIQKAHPLYLRLVQVSAASTIQQLEKQAQLAVRMILAMLADVQLISVYLVLEVQKLERLQLHFEEEALKAAWIHLNVHAPLAGRLGIFWIKSELEDSAFQILLPGEYDELKSLVASKREQRSKLVETHIQEIDRLLTSAGLVHEVQGRYKSFFSIFGKLKRVGNDFEQIHDLTAFRVLVGRIEHCYAALGYLHDHWNPVESRYKDYISKPKPNGYQSLHTTVLNDISEPLEIQVRTWEMHQVAEYGIAAHWRYKSGLNTVEKPADPSTRKKGKDVLPGWGKTPSIDLLQEKIFVMTPNKDIFEFPQGATPIDFAYAIHSQVGNRTVGAKTNGVITRLEVPLQNGDIVEIMTSPKQLPRKEWLDLVKTRQARNKIKHALHEQNREVCRRRGSEMLEKEFRSQGLNLNRMMREGILEKECRTWKNQNFDHLLKMIKSGSPKFSN